MSSPGCQAAHFWKKIHIPSTCLRLCLWKSLISAIHLPLFYKKEYNHSKREIWLESKRKQDGMKKQERRKWKQYVFTNRGLSYEMMMQNAVVWLIHLFNGYVGPCWLLSTYGHIGQFTVLVSYSDFSILIPQTSEPSLQFIQPKGIS